MMRLTIYLRRGLANVGPQKEFRTYDQVDRYESRDDLGVMHGLLILLSASLEFRSLWRELLELRLTFRIKCHDKAGTVEITVTCQAGLASEPILRFTNTIYVFGFACTFCRTILQCDCLLINNMTSGTTKACSSA